MNARLFIANVAIVFLIVACTDVDTSVSVTTQHEQPSAVFSEVGAIFTLRGETYQIAIAPEYLPGYDRRDWPTWERNVAGTCFDVRQKVLADESQIPVTISGCGVAGGLWQDPYTGRTFTNPGQLDIDHLVPLKEAYESGGYAWPPTVKYSYANYLGYEDHLVAVSASENRRKGARDPAEYLPPNPAIRCGYLEAWIRIKRDWALSMDEREANAIAVTLKHC